MVRRKALTVETAVGEERWRLPVLTVEEVLALPPSMEMVYAARALGIGRTAAGLQARSGRCLRWGDETVPVTLVGGVLRVKRADLLRVLDITDPAQAPARASAAEPAA